MLPSKRERRKTKHDSTSHSLVCPHINISIIQTKPFISANYIVTRLDGLKSRTTKHRRDTSRLKHKCTRFSAIARMCKTRVKKCKRAKNWKIDFANVCIFFFWTAPIFADFCQFCVPLLSLGVTFGAHK